MRYNTLSVGTNTIVAWSTIDYVSLPVSANTRYIVEGFVKFRTSVITTGLNLAWNFPTGTSFLGQALTSTGLAGMPASVTAPMMRAVASSTGASYAVDTINEDSAAYVWAIASTTATAGNLVPLFRPEITATWATIQAYSMWRLMSIT